MRKGKDKGASATFDFMGMFFTPWEIWATDPSGKEHLLMTTTSERDAKNDFNGTPQQYPTFSNFQVVKGEA